MINKPIHRWFEYFLLGSLAVLWGSSYLFIKIALADIPPLTLIAIRVSIASVFLMLVVVLQREKMPGDFNTWCMLLVQAVLNSIGAWTVLAWGQQFIDSGLASVLNSTSPIFVFFITLLITRHEPANVMRLIGALTGMSGVILIVGVDVLKGLGQQVAGQLAAITGALLYAAAAIYGKKFSHLPATVTAAGTMVWASIILTPVCLIVDKPWTIVFSVESVIAAIILAVLCTAVALLIYFRLLKTLGSIGVASQSYLRAGVGVVLGILVLGETMALLAGFGIVASLLGVVLINLPASVASGDDT